jgi:hypothetical protein
MTVSHFASRHDDGMTMVYDLRYTRPSRAVCSAYDESLSNV